MVLRPLFVGACPDGQVGDVPKTYSPLYPYPPDSVGYHLYILTNLRNCALYLEHSDRINLIPSPVTPWSTVHAQYAAQNLEQGGIFRDRLVILCGTRVQAAFFALSEVGYRQFEPCNANEDFVVAMMPHPNGQLPAWKDAEGVERCREFMRRYVFPQLPDKAFRS